MGAQPILYSFDDVDAVSKALRKYVIEAQNAAFQRHDRFQVSISGGSLPKTLAKGLLAESLGSEDKVDFSKWEIFFADERAVPLDHEDSNYKLLKEELLDKIPKELGTPIVHPINLRYLDDLQELADQYQAEILRSFVSKDSVKIPVFDLHLLGAGPDGHTCSLFPGHDLLRETDAWVGYEANSPKPPPRRITLTLPVLTHGLKLAYVTTGDGKGEILHKIFDTEEGKSLPCGLVNEAAGDKVAWFTDTKAVKGVQFPKKSSL